MRSRSARSPRTQDSTVLIADKCKNEKAGIGFDAENSKWVNMFDTGIIDPVKVTRSALQNAASIASLILTTECAITDIPAPRPLPWQEDLRVWAG